jgi:hypothetical protein
MSPPPRVPRVWTAGTRTDSFCVQQLRAGAFHRCPSGAIPSRTGAGSPSTDSTRLPFPTTLPTTPPKRCDLPHNGSEQMRFVCALPSDSQEGSDLPCNGCWRMPRPAVLPTDSPRGADLPRNGLGANALRHYLWTDSFRRRCRHRRRLDCPTLGAVARIRDKLVVASPE